MKSKSGRLNLDALTKEFGNDKEKVVAVRELTLTINPGEFVTLLGPSGCGKTTALRMIAGFETPTGGKVLLDGEDLSSLTPDKRPMGMVFQSYALFPHMSVFDNVAYGLQIKKLSTVEIKKAVSEVLGSMSLSHLANRAPNQLSGGQQQRVALARAMVVRPKVLLFDEPLSNLDAKLRAQMRIEIRSIQQKLGITSIFVTHDQDEAMSLSDRIVVMRNAVVEQVGTPDEVYRRPSSVFVADFIGRSNFLAVESFSKAGSGRAKIRVSGGKMVVSAQSNATASNQPVLLVRPESILVSPSKSRSSRPGKGEGLVENVVFYGNHVEYTLDTAEGRIISVVSDPIYEEIVPVGKIAKYSFDPSRAWLLPSQSIKDVSESRE
ncbi:MAG: ABC transporter ATP-binding protein [Actinobacteria bacterium]|nr:ABC transporter ATP-binding protein [Actinomycetota bacterium]